MKRHVVCNFEKLKTIYMPNIRGMVEIITIMIMRMRANVLGAPTMCQAVF